MGNANLSMTENQEAQEKMLVMLANFRNSKHLNDWKNILKPNKQQTEETYLQLSYYTNGT